MSPFSFALPLNSPRRTAVSSMLFPLRRAINAQVIEGFVEQAAMDAVSAAEAAGGTGTGKMTAALASLASSLRTKGITLAENELRLLIENELLAFKAAQASSGSGTSAPLVPAAGA